MTGINGNMLMSLFYLCQPVHTKVNLMQVIKSNNGSYPLTFNLSLKFLIKHSKNVFYNQKYENIANDDYQLVG